MRAFILAACLLLAALTASAGPIDSVIVVRDGLEWIWASPCAPTQPSCGANIVPNDLGFRIPTPAEWLASFTDTTDLYNAFGQGAQCGSSYFSSGYTHCDAGDVQGGYIWGAPQPIAGVYGGADGTSESFLVRGAVVPEPSTYGLVGLGLAAVAARRRRTS